MRKPAIILPPEAGEYEAYYQNYVSMASAYEDGIAALNASKIALIAAIEKIGEAGASFRYDTDKWNTNELLQHIVDCELIFLTRALRIARKDKQALAGFDQDLYVDTSKANDLNLFEILEQFKVLRSLTIITFTNLPQESIERFGIANRHKVSVRALAFIIAGHSLHHTYVLEAFYM